MRWDELITELVAVWLGVRKLANDNPAAVLLDSLVTVYLCRRAGRHSDRGHRHYAVPTLRWRMTT